MTALNLVLENADLNLVEACSKNMTETARKQLEELDRAMRSSATDFTRLAYKYGEAAIRRLTCKDFGPWMDYLAALSALGAAGKAVKSLAVAVARFTFGGRVPNEKSGGWYFRPTATFLVNFTVDKQTEWDFANLPDLGKRLQEAAAFAKANKGKLFTLQLTREPKKSGPLDSLLDAAFKNVYALSRKGSEDKKEAAKARKVENAILDLAADSGIDADKIRAAMQVLAGAKANVLKAKIARAKAAAESK